MKIMNFHGHISGNSSKIYFAKIEFVYPSLLYQATKELH